MALFFVLALVSFGAAVYGTWRLVRMAAKHPGQRLKTAPLILVGLGAVAATGYVLAVVIYVSQCGLATNTCS